MQVSFSKQTLGAVVDGSRGNLTKRGNLDCFMNCVRCYRCYTTMLTSISEGSHFTVLLRVASTNFLFRIPHKLRNSLEAADTMRENIFAKLKTSTAHGWNWTWGCAQRIQPKPYPACLRTAQNRGGEGMTRHKRNRQKATGFIFPAGSCGTNRTAFGLVPRQFRSRIFITSRRQVSRYRPAADALSQKSREASSSAPRLHSRPLPLHP